MILIRNIKWCKSFKFVTLRSYILIRIKRKVYSLFNKKKKNNYNCFFEDFLNFRIENRNQFFSIKKNLDVFGNICIW